MKLDKTFLRLLGCGIEWHWLFIKPGRKILGNIAEKRLRGNKKINTKWIILLNGRLNHHCTRAMSLTESYRRLAGLKYKMVPYCPNCERIELCEQS